MHGRWIKAHKPGSLCQADLVYSAMHGNFSRRSEMPAGGQDEFLAALWPGGSRDLSSQASEEVLALGQYHKQLLAMRTGSGLEGIEV
jgi:hypothetical protein